MTLDPYTVPWREFAIDNPWAHQFGQSDDESTFNGATGCTHTCWQFLIKALTGTRYSHDQLSSIAGYPWPGNNVLRRGMRTGGSDDESGRIIARFNLPYMVKWDLSWPTVRSYMMRGPVLVGIKYGYWPEDKGYRYLGRLADGIPGGFAYRNGKTQLYGAEGIYHATLYLGSLGMIDGYDRLAAREPNHASLSRPERPDYDIVTHSQASRAYREYGSGGRHLMAVVPTRTIRPKGY